MLKRLLAGDEDDHDDHDDHDDDHAGEMKGAEEHDDHDDHSDDEHDEHGAEEEEGIDVDTFKIIILFCMIVCVGFGLVPKVWGKCRNSENTLSMLNCFSAGIFLAMSLIHMMPESAEVYAIWAAEEGIERPFPLPYVMFFAGYMLILGIDRVAAKACGVKHDHGGGDEHDHNADRTVAVNASLIETNEKNAAL